MIDVFGVYVHIPFCSRRCDYCAFATWSDRDEVQSAYLEALRCDIERTVASGLLPPATSVFVGGGTPTRVDPALLAGVLAVIPTVDGAEVTIECNPESFTRRHAVEFVSAGVDRLSFGVQSLVPEVLRSLGRDHSPLDVERGVEIARTAGIGRINLDLIYGAAGESLDDWRRTLAGVLALAPDHISAYALTVEKGTPLADDPARYPDDDHQADEYLVADAILSDAGFVNYEISNWARPGQESRHNLLYWRQGDYLGFGCAAHSHRAGRRWWNVRTPERYVELVGRGSSVEASFEELDGERRRLEGLQLSLRTTDGVPVDSLAPDDLQLLDGLVTAEGARVRLTPAGRLVANEIAVRLR